MAAAAMAGVAGRAVPAVARGALARSSLASAARRRRAARRRPCVFGLGIGVATTARLHGGGAQRCRRSSRGVAFGYLTTAYLIGLAVSPVVAGSHRRAQHARGVLRGCASGWPRSAWIVRRRMHERGRRAGLTSIRRSCRPGRSRAGGRSGCARGEHRRVSDGHVLRAGGRSGIRCRPLRALFELKGRRRACGAAARRGVGRAGRGAGAARSASATRAAGRSVLAGTVVARVRRAARRSIAAVHGGQPHGRDSRAGSSGRARAGGGVGRADHGDERESHAAQPPAQRRRRRSARSRSTRACS